MQVKGNISEVTFEMADNDSVVIVGGRHAGYELRLGSRCVVKMSANRIIELRKEADQAIERALTDYERKDEEQRRKGG